MTLTTLGKKVQETFLANPTDETAMAYAKAVKAQFVNGEIGNNAVASIAAELEEAGFKLAMLHIME